ncbi:hypothetical protein [Paenibacillus wulumuqiensis]|uniref:hypothetical protein n=1 Tax=Paenibacillus wulumuqiensis TaxID=1567107 RepID=UPI0006199AF8|nr:hypothetical protein [Paenibacillus wulumuqiensis]
MSKKKFIIIIVLVFIILTIILINKPFGQIIMFSNNTVIDSNQSSVGKEKSDSNNETSQTKHGMIINDSLSNTTFQKEMIIPESYMKISIENDSSQNVTFTVNKDHSSGQQVMSGIVKPTSGYQKFYITAMLESGTYIITVSSGSAEMKGQLKVHIDTDINKLQADS